MQQCPNINDYNAQLKLAEQIESYGGIDKIEQETPANIVQQHLLRLNNDKSLLSLKSLFANSNTNNRVEKIIDRSINILAKAAETKKSFHADMMARIKNYPGFSTTERSLHIKEAQTYVDSKDFLALTKLYMSTNPLLPQEMFDYLAQKMGIIHEKQFVNLRNQHYSLIFGAENDTPSTNNRCWANCLAGMEIIHEVIEQNQQLTPLKNLLAQGEVLNQYKQSATLSGNSILNSLLTGVNSAMSNVNESLLANNVIKEFGIKQGEVGDCYVLSMLIGYLKNKIEQNLDIRDLIHHNEDGSVQIKFPDGVNGKDVLTAEQLEVLAQRGYTVIFEPYTMVTINSEKYEEIANNKKLVNVVAVANNGNDLSQDLQL